MAFAYDSLPTSSGPNVFRSRSQSLTVTRRPWRELLSHPTSYTLPRGFGEMMPRLKRNLHHFRVNYSMIILFVLFVSLLWHPISMIVFLVVFVGWWFLYLGRDEPIVVLHRMVDDRLVLVGLWIVTIIGLVLTKVWLNVLVSLLIGVVLVMVHAVFRNTEDLFLDEDEAASGGLVSVVDGTPAHPRF